MPLLYIFNTIIGTTNTTTTITASPINTLYVFGDIFRCIEALNYIHQIDQHNNDKTIAITDTGNVLVNAILMQKRAEFSNINIEFKGAIDNNIGINDYDLYVKQSVIITVIWILNTKKICLLQKYNYFFLPIATSELTSRNIG